MTQVTDSIETSRSHSSARLRSRITEAMAEARRAAGAMVRRVRNAVDQRLHARRRERAAARVQKLNPRSVLMVCFGNICRSPYAEYALIRALPGTDVQIGSAGFIGPDRPSPEQARAAAAAFGIDLRPHRSRVLTTEMLRAHDLVVVMEEAQRTHLVFEQRVPSRRILVFGDLDPEPIETRTILDPYGGPPEEFVRCYERVERCVVSLASVLKRAPDAR